jgi:hypothetical protein
VVHDSDEPVADGALAERGRARRWPTLPIVVAGGAVFIALSGSAVAATGLIQSKDIARGAVSSQAIKNGAVKPWDLSTGARDMFQGAIGQAG